MAARMAMMAMTTSNSISVKPPAGFHPFNCLKSEFIFGFTVYLVQVTPPAIIFQLVFWQNPLKPTFPK
jgi:hypothetical protein